MKRHATALAATVLLLSAAGVSAQEPQERGGAADRKYPARVSEGRVALEITPEWANGRMVFEVSANTHSVELSSLDLSKLVRLSIGDREYTPVAAGSLAGHHARARLVFDLPDRPAEFDLVIRDIPDVPLRRLSWPAGG